MDTYVAYKLLHQGAYNVKQPFAFDQQEVDKLAENADTLLAWLKEGEMQEPASKKQIKIPTHLLLLSSTFVASGLPVILDKYLPNGGCWYGGGCNIL